MKKSFDEEIAPWLDEIPDDYILILSSAICIATGNERAAPNTDHLVAETKLLSLYILKRAAAIFEEKK